MLFDTKPEEEVRDERWAKSKEQRAKSKEQRAESREQTERLSKRQREGAGGRRWEDEKMRRWEDENKEMRSERWVKKYGVRSPPVKRLLSIRKNNYEDVWELWRYKIKRIKKQLADLEQAA